MTTDIAIITRDLHFISTNLAQSQHLDDVIYFFLEKKIITDQIYDEFTKSNETEVVRAKRLVTYVAKNPDIMHIFIDALLKEGLTDIAGHIRPSSVDSLPRFPQNGIPVEKLPFIPSLSESPPPRSGSPCTPIIPHQPIGLPSGLPDSSNGTGALKIKVKSSCKKYGSDASNKDIYKNSSSPQGFVFIANFDSFDNDTYPSRPGSNVDVNNLEELFGQIGYTIVGPYINQTQYHLITAIEKFRETIALANIDSCVVAIMSHGKEETGFLTSDNKVLKYQELLEMFNNRECPALFGKPKIFIFQCCRGPITDEGVGLIPQRISHTIETTNTDAAFRGRTNAITSSPSFTDMYIIHSSMTGFVSYRSPERGSWLIEAICVEFMQNCCDNDLESLTRLVSRRLKSLYSDRGKKQINEIRNIGFDKQFYFNPISEPNESDSAQCFDEPDAPVEHQINHKRQRSNINITEGLNLCHSLMNYLQINEMDDMLVSAEEIKTKIKKKEENKRRKME